MNRADELKYRGVPAEVTVAAADAAWEFMEELDAAIRELEELGRIVANARLTADPNEWHRRLSSGRTAFSAVRERLAFVDAAMQRMAEHAPKRPS